MQVYLQLEHNELTSAKMSHSMQLYVIAGAAIETEDSLKPSLTADGQTKVHLQSTVWKQPKDTKDWGDEYISKEQPERGKDVGQSRYSSADNIICEPSLAGKDRGVHSCTHLAWAANHLLQMETHKAVFPGWRKCLRVSCLHNFCFFHLLVSSIRQYTNMLCTPDTHAPFQDLPGSEY